MASCQGMVGNTSSSVVMKGVWAILFIPALRGITLVGQAPSSIKVLLEMS
jgi:hypothetical protein